MKHIYRNLTAVLAGACVLSAAFCLPALAAEGWQQEAGTWTYVDSKGEQPTGQWKKIDNRWYYFEDDGRMAQDAWIDDSYVGEDGVRQESVWIKEASPDSPAEKWYYLKNDGRKAVEDDGWQKIGDSSYLFDADGEDEDRVAAVERGCLLFGNGWPPRDRLEVFEAEFYGGRPVYA